MVHVITHLTASYAVAKALKFNEQQTYMFIVANAIDIDHIFDGCVSCGGEIGGTFENNIFHKYWFIVVGLGALVHPYFSLGLAFHFYLDYINVFDGDPLACENVPLIPMPDYMLKEFGLLK